MSNKLRELIKCSILFLIGGAFIIALKFCGAGILIGRWPLSVESVFL